MRIRLLVLVSLILLAATGVVQAQTGGDWYLAWTLDGQLIRYSADGATKTLIDSGMNGDTRAWRLDDGSVFAMLGMDTGSLALFHITRDGAKPITNSDGVLLSLDGSSLRFLTKGNYAILIDVQHVPSGAAAVVNFATNTGTRLEQQVSILLDHSAAFSEDGAYFRYLGRETADSDTWTLRELKLETGAERVFYTIEDDGYAAVNTDTYGERWLYSQQADTILISRSGDSQTLSYDSPQDAIAMRYVGDHLMSYPVDCGTGCQITWTPLPDGEPLIFTIPQSDDIQIPNPIAQIDDSHLLTMMDSDMLWLLSTDGSSTPLGLWGAQSLVTSHNQLLSPDHRWLLTMQATEDAPAYQVLDLQTLKPVLQSDPVQPLHGVQITYGAGGFIVVEDGLRFRYFRYSDQQTFDLGEPNGTYWNVQPDGALLYAQLSNKGELARGIYRYDADTQAFTSLVDGGITMFIQETKLSL